jgi:hypothetical protein
MAAQVSVITRQSGNRTDDVTVFRDWHDLQADIHNTQAPMFCELLRSPQSTKVYFDYDRYIEYEPEEPELRGYLEAFGHDVLTILQMFDAPPNAPEEDVAVAHRHGWVDAQRYKVSFRAFVVNRIVRDYTEVGTAIKAASKAGTLVDDALDRTVYKSREQLLNLLGCTKTRMDSRVLTPTGPHASRPLHHFLASWLTGEETQLTLRLPPVPPPRAPAPAVASPPLPQADPSDAPPDYILRILNVISRERWDDYESWIHLGIALKNVGALLHNQPDRYRQAWITLSQRSPKFDSRVDPPRWDTFANPDFQGQPLGLRSLEAWALEDDPEIYRQIKSESISLAHIGFTDVNFNWDAEARVWTFRSSCDSCPCCDQPHPVADTLWTLTEDEPGEGMCLLSDAPGCLRKLVSPWHAMVAQDLAGSKIPSLLGGPSDQSAPEFRDSAFVFPNGGRLQLEPSLSVVHADGRRQPLHTLAPTPQLHTPPMYVKDVAASGWTLDHPPTQQVDSGLWEFRNPHTQPAAQLTCDFPDAPNGQPRRAVLSFPGLARRNVIRDKSTLAHIRDVVNDCLARHLNQTLGVPQATVNLLIKVDMRRAAEFPDPALDDDLRQGAVLCLTQLPACNTHGAESCTPGRSGCTAQLPHVRSCCYHSTCTASGKGAQFLLAPAGRPALPVP